MMGFVAWCAVVAIFALAALGAVKLARLNMQRPEDFWE